MLTITNFTLLQVQTAQMPKSTRRRSPNLLARSKLFPNHGHLLMAAQFAEYEHAQQSLREGYYVEVPDDRAIVFENWHVLEHMFPLPSMPDWPEGLDPLEPIFFGPTNHALMEEIDLAIQKHGLVEVCEQISTIRNTYDVICRSMDREVIRSKTIKYALAEPPPGTPPPDLLSPDEYKAIRELVYDSTSWRDFDEGHEEVPSYWEVLFQAQTELNNAGELSGKSREHLEQVLDLRSGLKRPRLYGPTVLILLLAELYEEKNIFGHKAALDADRRQVPKKEYMSEREYYGDLSMPEWKRQYPSPFGKFLTDLLGSEELQRLGKASIEKIVRNWRKLPDRKTSRLMCSSSGKADFSRLIEIIDQVKP